MTIEEYARAIAIATRNAMNQNGQVIIALFDEDIDAIIASVPKPTPQHHDAPMCVGWWWAWSTLSPEHTQILVEVWRGEDGKLTGDRGAFENFDRWVGPLLPPDTTTPAPDVTGICYCDGAVDLGCPVCTPSMRQPAPEVQAHDEQEPLDTHGRIYRAGLERGRGDAQAQIDAAYKRGVEDGLKRAKP